MHQFTEKDKQWLIDNYHEKKQCDCARHLGCSDNSVRRLAKELGIYESRKTYSQDTNKIKEVTTNEEGDGYCLDCCHYCAIGHCSKIGRYTGALHKKVCFEKKKNEKSSNN